MKQKPRVINEEYAMDSGMSYRVVNEFEAALCDYTGAKYAVTTNSGSMAIFLACKLFDPKIVMVPRRTYCSVPMQIVHAGHKVRFTPTGWTGSYELQPLPVVDSARRFTSGMYVAGKLQCVSFQTSKILGLEQGGAILHDNQNYDNWLRRARFDGRLDASEKVPEQLGWHCYMNPSTAALGLQRLACLPRNNPDQCGSESFDDLSGLEIW